MENLPLCRICLAKDVRLYPIESHLRDTYETITSMRFVTEDGRPLTACYICHTKLQNCYELQKSCFRSEELLTEITHGVSSGVLKPQDVLSANTFGVASALPLSLGHELQDSTECHVKEQALKVFYDAGPEDAEEVKLEIEDTILKENEPNEAYSPSESENNIYPEIKRRDLNDPRAGVPALKKLAENDHGVTDLEEKICKRCVVIYITIVVIITLKIVFVSYH